MQQTISIKVSPAEATEQTTLNRRIAEYLNIKADDITGFNIVRKSLDARGRKVHIVLTVQVYVSETFQRNVHKNFNFRDVSKAEKKVVIIGAGPAGLFAALQLIEHGVQPVLLERGKDVRARRRDLALLNKEGIINGESNYCFGEGGAGTYSDGKLYTRSNKRGDVNRILNLFVQFGAEEKILYEAHPHIGTNKLPQIITNIRQQILDSGGIFLFEKKVTALLITDDLVKGVKTSDGLIVEGDAVILATGHSARDIFQMLHFNNILVEFKPFALGVRIEHPQQLIDSIQYHTAQRGELLPPASYNLVDQVNNKAAFSFCMCPGGIIATASTNPEELVVNGWSPSKRNNPYANSGIVVPVEAKDIASLALKHGPLAGVHFQTEVEQRAYKCGGGQFVAPAQRMVDMVNNKTSSSLPGCSYVPGIATASMKEILPGFIFTTLQQSFRKFGAKMKGYLTNEAVVLATESRTSSPVRIPRNSDTLQHPQVHNLYPCGEGAGYAGGIVSAAMDGERVAVSIMQALKVNAFN